MRESLSKDDEAHNHKDYSRDGSHSLDYITRTLAALFAFEGLRSQTLTASLLGEQVAEAQRVRQGSAALSCAACWAAHLHPSSASW